VSLEPDYFTDVCADLLQHGCCVRFRADGHSMAPTIRPGETLIVEPLGAAAPRPGDILLYRWGAGVRAHRLLRIDRTSSASLVTQGDALDSPDAPVPTDLVIGRVRAVERHRRTVPLTGTLTIRRHLIRARLSRLRARWRRP
jgi:hypothetical protein